MDIVTLQVPMHKSLRDTAAAVAADYGFSSLQEAVRIYLSKLAKRQLSVSITEEPTVRLSKKNERRYLKMEADFRAGRNFKTANSLDEFFAQPEGR